MANLQQQIACHFSDHGEILVHTINHEDSAGFHQHTTHTNAIETEFD